MRYYFSWKTTGYYRKDSLNEIGVALCCQRMLAFLFVLRRVGGRVGLGGLVKYWGGLPVGRRSLIPVLTAAAGNRTRDRRVASRTP